MKRSNKNELLDQLEAYVIVAEQAPVRGKLKKLDAHGAVIILPDDEISEESLEGTVELNFLSSPMNQDITTRAVLRNLQKEDGRFACHFEFKKSSDDLKDIKAALGRYMNRRKCLRVKPHNFERVKVKLEWEEGKTEGRMSDISITGMGIEVDRQNAVRMGIPQYINLYFKLPDCETPIRLAASIAYSKPNGSRIHYGVKFEWGKTLDFYRHEEAIAAYVNCREKGLLLYPV